MILRYSQESAAGNRFQRMPQSLFYEEINPDTLYSLMGSKGLDNKAYFSIMNPL